VAAGAKVTKVTPKPAATPLGRRSHAARRRETIELVAVAVAAGIAGMSDGMMAAARIILRA
jgi:hypothetical protein